MKGLSILIPFTLLAACASPEAQDQAAQSELSAPTSQTIAIEVTGMR